LYLLATGPYHQDFSIPLPNAPGARLSFNLKIAQLVKIKLRLNEVKLIPKNKEFPGDTFTFGMRSIVALDLARSATRRRRMDFRTGTRSILKIRISGVVCPVLTLLTPEWERRTVKFRLSF